MNISIVILKMFMEPAAKTNKFILCSLLGLVIFTVKHELALVLILDGPLTFILGCGGGGMGIYHFPPLISAVGVNFGLIGLQFWCS